MKSETLPGQSERVSEMIASEPPKPGSAAAVEQGCTCPRWVNRDGQGAWEYEGEMQWWMAEGCPLHGCQARKETEE